LVSSNKLETLKKLSASSWKRLLAIGLVGGGIPFIMFFEGLRTVSATNATLIHKSLFIWVTFMAIPILGEKLSKWQVGGFIIVSFSMLLANKLTFPFGKGELLIFTATVLWSVENILAKIALKKVDSQILSWARMFFGSTFLFIFAVSQNKAALITSVTLPQLVFICGSIFFLSAYVTCWYKSLKYAPASLVSSILILSTPITAVLTDIFINNSFSIIPTPKLSLIILGLAMIVFAGKKPTSSALSKSTNYHK